jgi:hypothetical protein
MDPDMSRLLNHASAAEVAPTLHTRRALLFRASQIANAPPSRKKTGNIANLIPVQIDLKNAT